MQYWLSSTTVVLLLVVSVLSVAMGCGKNGPVDADVPCLTQSDSTTPPICCEGCEWEVFWSDDPVADIPNVAFRTPWSQTLLMTGDGGLWAVGGVAEYLDMVTKQVDLSILATRISTDGTTDLSATVVPVETALSLEVSAAEWFSSPGMLIAGSLRPPKSQGIRPYVSKLDVSGTVSVEWTTVLWEEAGAGDPGLAVISDDLCAVVMASYACGAGSDPEWGDEPLYFTTTAPLGCLCILGATGQILGCHPLKVPGGWLLGDGKIVAGPSGNMFVATGYIPKGNSRDRVHVMRVDVDGTIEWRMDLESATGDVFLRSLERTETGVVIGGSEFDHQSDLHTSFVASVSDGGELLWRTSLDESESPSFVSLTVGEAGAIYVLGVSPTTSVIRLSAEGRIVACSSLDVGVEQERTFPRGIIATLAEKQFVLWGLREAVPHPPTAGVTISPHGRNYLFIGKGEMDCLE